MADNQFYLRYYVGHTGKYGHEFLEFEFRPDGEVRGCSWQLRAADGLLLLLLGPTLRPCSASADALQEQLKLQE
jgi:hypothetical protein